MEHILSVAARLFADKGYDATSMREIAEGAGVAKPTIYYYFQSKEGLLARLLEEGFGSLRKEIEAISLRGEDADPYQNLVDTVWVFFDFAMKHQDLIRFIHALAFGPSGQPASRSIDKSFHESMDAFQRVLARAGAGGVLRTDNLEQAGVALRGVTTTYIVQYLKGWSVLTRDLAQRIVDGFLSGYGNGR
jgi:AcrR family transcriptional regulator